MARFKVKYKLKNCFGIDKDYDHIVEFKNEKELAKAMKDAGVWSFEYIEIKEKKEPTIQEIKDYCGKKSSDIVDKINIIVFEKSKDKLSDNDIEEINKLLKIKKMCDDAYYNLLHVIHDFKVDKENE